MKITLYHWADQLDPDEEYTTDQIDLITEDLMEQIDTAVLAEFPHASVVHRKTEAAVKPAMIIECASPEDGARALQILEDIADRGTYFAAASAPDAPAPTVYRMASTQWLHTPGVVEWVRQSVLPFDPAKARELLSALGFPDDAVAGIVGGTATLTTEDETLVVTL